MVSPPCRFIVPPEKVKLLPTVKLCPFKSSVPFVKKSDCQASPSDTFDPSVTVPPDLLIVQFPVGKAFVPD